MSGTKMTVGSRAQVFHGTAKHTSGGLTKTQLMMNRSGRIVSRKKHHSAKKDNRLVKAGYKTKKGHFGFVKVGSRKRAHKGRKGHRGGSGIRVALSPLELGDGIDGQGLTNYGSGSNDVQMASGMSGGAIYGSDAIGADLSTAYGTSDDMKGPSGDGIAGAGITDFGAGSIGAQMRAGMAGGRRRKGKRSRGMMGGTGYPEMMENGPLQDALMAASGGRRRKSKRSRGMMGGTMNRGHFKGSDMPGSPLNAALTH